MKEAPLPLWSAEVMDQGFVVFSAPDLISWPAVHVLFLFNWCCGGMWTQTLPSHSLGVINSSQSPHILEHHDRVNSIGFWSSEINVGVMFDNERVLPEIGTWKPKKCKQAKDIVGGSVSGDSRALLWDSRCLCESWLHLLRAWTGPRSVAGWQACLWASLGQLRWRVAVWGLECRLKGGVGFWQGQTGQPSVREWASPCNSFSCFSSCLLYLSSNRKTKTEGTDGLKNTGSFMVWFFPFFRFVDLHYKTLSPWNS